MSPGLADEGHLASRRPVSSDSPSPSILPSSSPHSSSFFPLAAWVCGRFVDAEFVADNCELAFAEMISGGTTCINDMYFFPESTAEVAVRAGLRAVVGLILMDFPTSYAKNADEYYGQRTFS